MGWRHAAGAALMGLAVAAGGAGAQSSREREALGRLQRQQAEALEAQRAQERSFHDLQRRQAERFEAQSDGVRRLMSEQDRDARAAQQVHGRDLGAVGVAVERAAQAEADRAEAFLAEQRRRAAEQQGRFDAQVERATPELAVQTPDEARRMEEQVRRVLRQQREQQARVLEIERQAAQGATSGAGLLGSSVSGGRLGWVVCEAPGRSGCRVRRDGVLSEVGWRDYVEGQTGRRDVEVYRVEPAHDGAGRTVLYYRYGLAGAR